jgi:hypothetical protein
MACLVLAGCRTQREDDRVYILVTAQERPQFVMSCLLAARLTVEQLLLKNDRASSRHWQTLTPCLVSKKLRKKARYVAVIPHKSRKNSQFEAVAFNAGATAQAPIK